MVTAVRVWLWCCEHRRKGLWYRSWQRMSYLLRTMWEWTRIGADKLDIIQLGSILILHHQPGHRVTGGATISSYGVISRDLLTVALRYPVTWPLLQKNLDATHTLDFVLLQDKDSTGKSYKIYSKKKKEKKEEEKDLPGTWKYRVEDSRFLFPLHVDDDWYFEVVLLGKLTLINKHAGLNRTWGHPRGSGSWLKDRR